MSAALNSGCQVAAQRFRPRKPLAGLFIGLFYGVVLSAGALLCAGPGDGTYTPFVWSSAPLLLLNPKAALLLTPLFWAGCGFLAELKQSVWSRALLPVLLLAQYTTALVLTFNERFYDAGKLRECMVLVIPFAVVYLAGQILLWLRIFRNFVNATKTLEGPNLGPCSDA